MEIQWLPPVLFSLDVCVWLYAVLTATKLSYSRTRTCTKLNLVPYYIIIAYLTCELLELTLIIHEVNTYDVTSSISFFESMIWVFVDSFSMTKFGLFMLFVNVIVFEWIVMWGFMLFQQDLDLDVLQVR